MKVRNMTGRTGQEVANQFVIEFEKGFTTWLVFQSYQTPVAIKNDYNDKIALSTDWDCSVTTAKYVAKFLNMSTTEIRSAIKAEKIMVHSKDGFKRITQHTGRIK